MRRYLTQRERAKMLEEQGGVCAKCGRAASSYIGEHTTPVALGNDEKPDALYCVACAKRKTHGDDGLRGDISAIAKAKRIAEGRTQHDLRAKHGSSLRSRNTFRRRGD